MGPPNWIVSWMLTNFTLFCLFFLAVNYAHGIFADILVYTQLTSLQFVFCCHFQYSWKLIVFYSRNYNTLHVLFARAEEEEQRSRQWFQVRVLVFLLRHCTLPHSSDYTCALFHAFIELRRFINFSGFILLLIQL